MNERWWSRCEESKRRLLWSVKKKTHSEEEQSIVTLNWSSDHSERIALAWWVAKLKEIDLEGWTSCQKYKEENPSKEKKLKSDMKSTRFELQFALGQKLSNTFLPLY